MKPSPLVDRFLQNGYWLLTADEMAAETGWPLSTVRRRCRELGLDLERAAHDRKLSARQNTKQKPAGRPPSPPPDPWAAVVAEYNLAGHPASPVTVELTPFQAQGLALVARCRSSAGGREAAQAEMVSVAVSEFLSLHADEGRTGYILAEHDRLGI